MNYWIENKIENDETGHTIFDLYRQTINEEEEFVGQYSTPGQNWTDAECLSAWRNQRVRPMVIGSIDNG